MACVRRVGCLRAQAEEQEGGRGGGEGGAAAATVPVLTFSMDGDLESALGLSPAGQQRGEGANRKGPEAVGKQLVGRLAVADGGELVRQAVGAAMEAAMLRPDGAQQQQQETDAWGGSAPTRAEEGAGAGASAAAGGGEAPGARLAGEVPKALSLWFPPSAGGKGVALHTPPLHKQQQQQAAPSGGGGAASGGAQGGAPQRRFKPNVPKPGGAARGGGGAAATSATAASSSDGGGSASPAPAPAAKPARTLGRDPTRQKVVLLDAPPGKQAPGAPAAPAQAAATTAGPQPAAAAAQRARPRPPPQLQQLVPAPPAPEVLPFEHAGGDASPGEGLHGGGGGGGYTRIVSDAKHRAPLSSIKVSPGSGLGAPHGPAL